MWSLAAAALLVASASVAGSSLGDPLVINLVPGDPGRSINPTTVTWPKNFDEQVQLVNEGKAEFYCEVSTDTTQWAVAKQARGGNVAWRNAMYDGGEAMARFQSACALLRGRGLERDAVRLVARYGTHCYIKIYAVALPEPMVIQHTTLQSPDGTSVSRVGLGLMAGFARAPIVDVTPIVVGTVIVDRRFLIEGQFGNSMWKKDRSVVGIGETSTFHRTTGARAGIYLRDPWWLGVGFFQEENLIRDPEQYGDQRLYRYRAAEVGLLAKTQHLAGFLTFSWGLEKAFGGATHDHGDVRLGLVVGNTWGWN